MIKERYAMYIGEHIQQLRKKSGWSQSDLANKIDVSRQTISKWELGETLPDTENVLKLCTLFEIRPNDLLYANNTDASTGKTEKNSSPSVFLHKSRRGIALLLGGVLILGILGILSQIIPSKMKIIQSVTMADTQNISEEADAEEARVVYSYITATGFLPFLNTYYLHWVVAIGVACICWGAVFLIQSKRKIKQGERYND